MDDLLRIAEIACHSAVQAGAEFADASVERGRGISVSVEKSVIKSSDARLWAGVSVRAFVGGGTGWFGISGISEEQARKAGVQAAEMGKAAEPDPDFVDLVSPAQYPEVSGIYDSALAAVAPAEVAAWLVGNIDSAQSVASEAIVSGGASATWRDGLSREGSAMS